MIASPIASAFKCMPGPLVVVIEIEPPNAAPMAAHIAGDFVLGLERLHAVVLVF